jgi:hypothetical protein
MRRGIALRAMPAEVLASQSRQTPRPGRRRQKRLQMAAVDGQPLLPGELLVQIGRCDAAAFAANDEHVGTLHTTERNWNAEKPTSSTISVHSIAGPRCHRLFKRWRWSDDTAWK